MVFMATKMENQYLSLLKVYEVQTLSKPALNKFFTSFLTQNENMNNFAFLQFSKSNSFYPCGIFIYLFYLNIV